MFAIEKVKTRFRPSHNGRPLAIGSIPRLRITMIAALIKPNTAPDAPAPTSAGPCSSTPPNDPASMDTK
jgi:hypothetical protein